MNPHRAPSARLRRLLARLGGWPRRTLAAALLLAAVAVGVLSRSPTPGPAPPERVTVLAAARNLPAGSELRPADLRPLRLPPDAVPAHALTPGATVAGRRLVGPVRRGETLTDVRLVGAGLADALAGSGLVAVPVRLADPATVRLLHPGDHVDVLAAWSEASVSRAGPASGSGPGSGSGSGGGSGSAPGAPGTVTSPDAGSATGPDTDRAARRDRDGDQRPDQVRKHQAEVLASNLAVLAVPPSDPELSDGAWVVLAASESAARRLAGVTDGDRLTVTVRPP